MVGRSYFISTSTVLASPASPSDFERISLVGGWLPTVIQGATALLIIVAVVRRSRRWSTFWLPIAGAIGIVTGGLAWWYVRFEGIENDSPPYCLWMWIGLGGMSLAVAIFGFVRASWWLRCASVLSTLMCVLSAALILNSWVGYWPTTGTAWDGLTGVPLPHEISTVTMVAMQRERAIPDHGTIVRLDSGSAGSHFSHRQEFVYLPPAWYSENPPPKLPAVLMIDGEFGKPTDWLLGGGLYSTIDNFALMHRGYAPIFVFGDATGYFRNDTECVNGTRGNAADHLTKEVIPAVIRQFGASDHGANWGAAGWSMGGTCAVDLAVMHPDLFTSFVDIEGDLGPNAGSRAQTITRLFGGDASAYDNFDPGAVMRKHGPYVGVAGWFSPPVDSTVDAPNRKSVEVRRLAASQLCSIGEQVGIACAVVPFGVSHTMQHGTQAFASALPWLASQLGTPTAEKVVLPISELPPTP